MRLSRPLGEVKLRRVCLPGRKAGRGAGTAVRLGIDLVEISKVRRLLESSPALVATVFTDEELRYCRTKRVAYPHLAARFAAKEAALKALGTGLTGKLAWTDIEVVKEFSGAPRLVLHGVAEEMAGARGIVASSLSLSHSSSYAIAMVLFVSDGTVR